MKKTTILIIVVLFMVIGYAAYNTTINIYGNGKLAENLSDFKVYLSSLKVNGKEVSGINNTKDGFTINDINDTLEYEITNDSTEYDTESYLECVKEDENVGKSWNFDYTGTIQNFLTPADGRYKLETWGAQGGDGTYPSSSSAIGGYGGYSVGTYSLIKNAKLFILIGGKGTSGVMPANSSATNTVSTGGFNGGGNGSNAYDGQYFYGTGGGGGATNISYNNDFLKNGSSGAVLIASGGGGGGSLSWSQNEGYNKYVGGSGGGYIGGNGTGWPNYSYGIGGTQSLVSNVAYAGLFGAGGDGATGGSGGGSGYYGGTGSRTWASAGGGSGYIGNTLLTEKSMYCYNCQESSETDTRTIKTSCVNSSPTENCAKQGNGYARITLISSPTSITTDKITISAQESTSQDLKNVNGKILTCKLKVNKISRTEKKEYTGPTEWTFDYTGGEQTFTAPVTGTYKIETWGAQGGYAQTSEAFGGYGGYSFGQIALNKDDMLYAIVGGKGEDGLDYSISKVYEGGYNGGGNAKSDAATVWGAGGGATSIQKSLINDGQLKNYLNDISEVLVVAAGGGGGGWHYKAYLSNPKSPFNPHPGGSGGGYIGSNGVTEIDSLATGGSQTKYGTNGNANRVISNAGFGYGGNYEGNQNASGGGSGFYGGGSAYYNGSSGAGGSGYIGNSLLTEKSMYCYNCTESTEENTKTISTTCTNSTPTENCAKKGNGYARITLISY